MCIRDSPSPRQLPSSRCEYHWQLTWTNGESMSYTPRGLRALRAPRRLPWATSVAGTSGTR
eukprot:10917506-Alexandrium_andersonii.AAC.1